MYRLTPLLVIVALGLAGCATGPKQSDEGIYRIRASDAPEIEQNMFEAINQVRANAGRQPLTMNSALSSAASDHASEMSQQRRVWPFSSDGSTPYDRVQRAGYSGQLVGEVYNQTFETETEALQSWMQDATWGDEILSPDATEMGFGWRQDSNGLLWWVVTLGTQNISAAY
jgi:uncharacterized protein YkwD